MTEKYFKSLNYTMANEDTQCEVDLVLKLRPKTIFAVAGSGGRALPLLAAFPDELVCLDLSHEQLALVELRIALIKDYSYEDYLLFWGYPPYLDDLTNKRRQEIFENLKLSDDKKSFFREIFVNENWGPITYLGKWEKTFQLFSKVPQFLLGSKFINHLFSYESLDEQKDFLNNRFPHLRWKMILRILGNSAVFNALLYKGHFVKKNVPISHYDYYKNAFSRIFNQTLLKANFFAQLCFFGKIIDSKAIPVEGAENNFHAVKEWLQNHTKISLVQDDFFNYFDKTSLNFDYVSLSDVPSYFQGNNERDYLQKIYPHLNSGGIVVVRNYLRIPEGTNLIGFEDVSSNYQSYFEFEKVQMYMVRVYKKI